MQGGTVTAMALGPGNSRSFLGAPGATQTPLEVVDPSAVAGLAIENLPNVVEHVGDLSDGHVLVITGPMDPYGTSEFHLFYGDPSRMVEYPIAAYDTDDYGIYVSFAVDGTQYNAFFNDPFEIDGGSGPGPGSFYRGDRAATPALQTPPGALSLTEKPATSDSLSGMTFFCK